MTEYLPPEQILRNREKFKKIFLTSLSWAARSEKAKAFIEANIGKDARVLDIGCGGGGFLKMLKDGGYKNLHGFDIDNYAKFEDIKDLVATGDLNFFKIPFADKSFDLITAFCVMEHLENPFHFERECARLLKTDGTLILAVPSGQSLWSRLNFFVSNNITGYDSANNHITFLLADVFKKIFLKDFEIAAAFYDTGFVPYLPCVKLPAHRLFSKRVCYFLKKKG